MTLRRAVLLDRDGVLDVPVVADGRERPPWSLEELVVVSEARAALERLHAAGWVLVVVTNQPDVGRGQLPREVADAINDRVRAELPLDAVYACFHGGDEVCACRKPAPGMLLDAARDLGLDLGASWLVGDRWVDIAAGRAAGVRTVLVQRPASWAPSSAGFPPPDVVPDAVVAGIQEAAATILADRS